MTISDEAVEAATRAHAEHGGETNWEDWEQEAKDEAMGDMRSALEAAAPHLMAQALDEAADDYRHYATPNARLYLRERAADLRE